MEVRDKRVDAFEFVGGIDKDTRIAGTRGYESAFVRNRFKRPYARRSYRDNPSALAFCPIDFFGVLLVYFIELGMHFVLCNVVHLNGAKSAESHVQKNPCELHALFFKSGDEFGRKM